MPPESQFVFSKYWSFQSIPAFALVCSPSGYLVDLSAWLGKPFLRGEG